MIAQVNSVTEEDLREFVRNPSIPNSGNNDSESPQTPVPSSSQFSTIDFEDPAELVSFFNEDINNGLVTLHPWQVDQLEELAAARPNSQHPFKFALCAANGSGKDKFVIAPFSVWFILTKIRSRVLITSSSGVQLTNQTEKYIRDLATSINVWHFKNYGSEIFDIKQRHIECKLSGSLIEMFATDEEGKAEGYHPLEPNSEFAIIVNEAKSVSPEIFRALRRCTGFNYWINVSTPGEPHGDFYKSFLNWPNKRRVTFFDCPHLSRQEFEEERLELGEHNPLFRSKWLALFTTIGGNFVVNQMAMEKLERLLKAKAIAEKFQSWPTRIGVDLAAGGDENVISVWRGNKQIDQLCFREIDTTKAADRIATYLEKYVHKNHEHIFADDGGIGHAVIDMLVRKGWAIRRVKNNYAAHNKKDYKNRGAELWAKFARFIEEGVIIPIWDSRLIEQISTRRYKGKEGGVDKMQLESKAEAKADGLASPDRADAAVLAFTDVSIRSLLEAEVDVKAEELKTRRLTPEQIEEKIFAGILEETRKSTRIRNSLSVALRHHEGNYGSLYKWRKN